MSTADMRIEVLDEGTYLVRGIGPGDPVVTRLRLTEGFVESLGVVERSGSDIATAVVTFLLAHQRLDQLPPQIDIEDVCAAYDDAEVSVRRALGADVES